jgi:hypothetical protein
MIRRSRAPETRAPVDVVLLPRRQHHRPRQPSHDRGGDEADRQHRRAQPRPRGRDDGDGDDQRGQRHDELDHAHADPVEPPSPVSRHQADGNPDQQSNAQHLDAGQQRDPGPVHEPAELIATEMVRSQPVLGRRFLQCLVELTGLRIVGGQHRGEQSDEAEHRQERRRHTGRTVVQHALSPTWAGEGCRHSARTFGLSQP